MATSKISGPLPLAEVNARMLAKLAFSKLDAKDAKTLKFNAMTADACKALKLPKNKAGFKIPYFDPSGKPRSFFRYRYLEDTRSGFAAAAGTKEMRYAQPANSPVELYLPPNGMLSWQEIFDDPTLPIMFTEGELKAACSNKFGIPTIGLGGVWSFQSTKDGKAMLPIFDLIEFNERSVYICYDSDGATNPQVVNAESRFAARLLERGATVAICRLEAAPPNEPGGKPYKVGVDDYIVAHGVESFRDEILDTAFPYAASEALHEMNGKVVYVRDPGLIWAYDSEMRMSHSAFTEHAFSNYHFFEARQTAQGEKLVKTPTAKAWMAWEHRAECSRLAFEPGQQRITEAGELNTWLGWGIPEPMEGDWSEWDRLLAHIFGEDFEARRFFERWCAWPLQNPGGKMNIAVAVWGPVHGSGKTLIGNTLQRIYGPKHSLELKDSALEDDRFEWAENKQFILADDITSRGDRKFMRKLMTMVTQKTIRMNPKYIPSYSLRDTINYMFTSNDPDALFMDDEDRRFFVHEVTADKFKLSHQYVDWMNSASGIAALWHRLMALDMGDFDPFAPAPKTLGKESMIELGKSELGAWVYELKHNTESVLSRGRIKGDLVSAKQLHAMFDPNGDKRASVNAMARELKRAGFRNPANGLKLKLSDGQQLSVYAVRNPARWADYKATWRAACDHFEEHNQQLVAPVVKKKF